MQVVTPEELGHRLPQRFDTPDGVSTVTHLLNGPGPDNEEPSAFLVEFKPYAGGAIRPHFHKVAQFQVVIGGDGHIGKVPVPPISFQYADPSTPYGPITPIDDDRGIDFLTLRPIARAGLWWMPGNHHELEGRRRRNRAGSIDPEAPLPAEGSERRTLIEGDIDGLAGDLVRLSPGAWEEITADRSGSGQYQLVTRGSLLHEGRELPRLTLLWLSPGESCRLGASAQGAEVLVMQFPSGIVPAVG